MHRQLKVKPPQGTKFFKKMKATKQISEAVKTRYNLEEKEYKIYRQARMFGENGTTFDVAVIYFGGYFFVIRTWKNGGIKSRAITNYESYNDVFMKYLNLDE